MKCKSELIRKGGGLNFNRARDSLMYVFREDGKTIERGVSKN